MKETITHNHSLSIPHSELREWLRNKGIAVPEDFNCLDAQTSGEEKRLTVYWSVRPKV